MAGTTWRTGDFVMLVVTMTLAGFCVFAVVINLVPLLIENGLTTSLAAIALGVGGVGQVAGRLFYGPVVTRLGPRARTVTTLLTVAATTLGLAYVHAPVVLLLVISFAAGAARGIFTLIQATAVVDAGAPPSTARATRCWGGVTAAAAFAVLAVVAVAAAALVRPARQSA